MQNNLINNDLTATIETLKIKSQLIFESMWFFHERKFLFVETPIISESIHEYSSDDFLVISNLHGDIELVLSQSPQLY